MKYYLLGKKLGHSYSPAIYKLLGNPDYSLLELPEEALEDFFRARDFDGCNVTVPYKEKVMPLLDEIDPVARSIGAVNTVVKRSGRLIGYNTDIDGLKYLVRSSGIDPAGKHCLILGSGGTSKTSRAALAELSAGKITVVSRSGEVNYGNVGELCPDAGVIINTTPVGMFPDVDSCPVELSDFPKLSGVIDVIYNPSKTELLLRAGEMGIKSIGGLPMLVMQACHAYSHFFGVPTPEKRAEEITKEIENGMKNIALVGMPGSGKSTLGKLLAEKLGRRFYDLDEVISERENMTVPEIFASKGEKYFRDAEEAVCREKAALSGCVISCGGGTVLRESNTRALSRNSRVIFLKRKQSELATEGRPLSADREALDRLAAERNPIYEKVSDLSMNVSADIEKSLKTLMEILK